MTAILKVKQARSGVSTDYAGRTIDRIVVSIGRDRIDDPMYAPTCQATLVRSTTAGVVDLDKLHIGDRLYWYPNSGRGRQQFGGEITDLVVDQDVVRITAVASGARLPSLAYTTEAKLRKRLKDVLADLEDTVVSPIFGNTITVSGPGADHPYQLLVPYQTVTTYGDLLDSICACNPSTTWRVDPDTEFYVNPYGITIQSGADRKAASSSVTFTSAEIVYDWRFELTASDRVTTVTYQDELDQTYTLDFLQGTTPPTSISTDCPWISRSDAESVVAGSYGPRVDPEWRIGTITVTNAGMTNARAATVGASMFPGALITLPTLTTGAPSLFFIEGVRATYTGTDGDVVVWELALSARELTVPGDLWTEAPPALTWAATSASLTWIDALKGDL